MFAMVQYQDTTPQQAAYLKGNQPVVNIMDQTWSLPILTSLQVLACRVGNISAEQVRNMSETNKVVKATDKLGSV